MKRLSHLFLSSVAAIALAAVPAVGSADVDDWGWYGDSYYDGYGYDEYGTGLFGDYDDEDFADDWYYDTYDYGDTYTGIYDDYADDYAGENELEYDADLFGDDEWEYGEGNDFFDPGIDYEGYGYDEK